MCGYSGTKLGIQQQLFALTSPPMAASSACLTRHTVDSRLRREAGQVGVRDSWDQVHPLGCDGGTGVKQEGEPEGLTLGP